MTMATMPSSKIQKGEAMVALSTIDYTVYGKNLSHNLPQQPFVFILMAYVCAKNTF